MSGMRDRDAYEPPNGAAFLSGLTTAALNCSGAPGSLVDRRWIATYVEGLLVLMPVIAAPLAYRDPARRGTRPAQLTV
jgi:hypothetical protein